MKYIKNTAKTAASVAAIASTAVLFSAPALAVIKKPDHICKLPGTNDNLLFGFPRWWEFLQGDQIGDRCTPFVSWPSGVWGIGLAVLDVLLRVAGMAAVISIMVSSVMYLTSAGDPGRAGAALSRIINSLVGLAIVVVAAGVVHYIGKSIT